MPRYYVYEGATQDGHVFYVGKGTGSRIYEHETDVLVAVKRAIKKRLPLWISPNTRHWYIYDAWKRGENTLWNKVLETDDECIAIAEERQRISLYGLENLTNHVLPTGTSGGCKQQKVHTPQELVRQLEHDMETWPLSPYSGESIEAETLM